MKKITALSLVACAALAVVGCSPLAPEKAPRSEVKIVDDSLVDASLLARGTFSFSQFDYDSGALVDDDVLAPNSQRIKTDIRGRLYLPTGTGPFPVVVFLHGNHGTCGLSTGTGNPRVDTRTDFTLSGRCPSGYVESPSHLGYEASAQHLASWGYAVLSVNANRGITGREGSTFSDSGLIYARGLLVLRHLEEFYKWSRDGRSSLIKQPADLILKSKLDFAHVGLMGHSRGGEGVRYAYNIYSNSSVKDKWQQRIPGMRINGIFEIGPVDMGANSGKVEARGTAWNVLIPGCDRDVYDFSGVNPFARMLESQEDGFPKSVFTQWGANHNFFNSEWQVSDAPHECIGEQVPLWDTDGPGLPSPYNRLDENARAGLLGSRQQIEMEKGLLFAFFHAHLGGNEQLGHVFDPQFRLPSQLSALGSTSREYLSGREGKLIFDGRNSEQVASDGDVRLMSLDQYLKEQLDVLTNSWQAYSDAYGYGRYAAVLQSSLFPRPALVIAGETESRGEDVLIPLPRSEEASGYWTLDLSLALRKECYAFDVNLVSTCGEESVDSDFDVSLVLANGTETDAVSIRDYIKLDNWYNQMLSRSGTKHVLGATQIVYEVIPILYQTARFELTDFGRDVGAIKAIKLHFPQNSSVSLVLESARLSKGP